MSKHLNLCDFCQEKLSKRENWEVNFKKEIEENCKINEGWKEFKGKKACEHGYKICGQSSAGYDYEMLDSNNDWANYRGSSRIKTTKIISCKDCRKNQKKITDNNSGDKLEENISNGCHCHKEDKLNRERERERERAFWATSNLTTSNLSL